MTGVIGGGSSERSFVRQLADRGERRQLKPLGVLCVEGDLSDDVYVVESGELHASVGVMAGGVLGRGTARDIRIGTHPAGSLVGELSALSGGHRATTLIAGSDGAAVSVVSRDALASFIDENPTAGAALTEQARMRMDRIRAATLFSALLGPAFVDLTPDMAERATWRHLAADEVLFEQGDESDGVYLVVSGRLAVTAESPADGAHVRVAEIGRGEVVGELGLIDQAPRSKTITALRRTTLAFLPERVFTEIAANHPGVALAFARYALTRLGHEAPGRRPTVIALAAADGVDRENVDLVADELGRLGSFGRLDAARVDRLLGREDAAQSASGTGLHVRLVELFHEITERHDYVLVEIDADATAWSRSALDHADVTVIAVPVPASGTVGEQVTGLRDAIPQGCRVDVVQVNAADATRPATSAAVRSSLRANGFHHVRGGNEADAARVARLVTGRGTALVLGGGGARGFAHLGVLRALRELSVPVDRIVGASIGAVIAAAAAQDLRPDEMVSLAEQQFANLLDYTLPVVSVLKGKRITENIDAQFGGWDIADLWTPFACVTTNLTRSRVEVHRSGDTATAVRASVAIPGILPPVPSGDDLLVDGGVLNNLPVDIALQDPSIETVIAVDVAPPLGPRAQGDFGLSVSGWEALRSRVRRARSEYPGLAAVLIRSMLVGAARDRDLIVAEGEIDLLLDLDLRGIGLLEFDRVRDVADRGYEAAVPRIEAWLASR